MKKTILQFVSIVILLSAVQATFAQTKPNEEVKSLQEKLQKAEAVNAKLITEIKNLKTVYSNKLAATTDSIEKIKSRLQANEQLVQNLNEQLVNKISTVENSTIQRIEALDKTLSSNTLYWIIAVLCIALLSVLLFFGLRNQILKNKNALTENISQTKKELEQEVAQSDKKLVELLATQLQQMKAELQSIQKK